MLQTLENSNISIRLRLSGEPWMDFSTLILVSQNAMILQEGAEPKMIMNLRNVVEFEIDKPHLDYLPNNHYEITY